MNAYKLNSYHALPTKEGFLVVGYNSISLQSRREFGNVSYWEECPVQDFISAYEEIAAKFQKEFLGGLCAVLDEVEETLTPELV